MEAYSAVGIYVVGAEDGRCTRVMKELLRRV